MVGKDSMEVARLRAEGKNCSQVMMAMSMQKLGIEDDYLVRAMQGLGGGMGVRHCCGILTGIACGMSLADPELAKEDMFPEMFSWFYETYGEEHGGVNCAEILEEDYTQIPQVCPGMIDKSWEKACEIFEKYGFSDS